MCAIVTFIRKSHPCMMLATSASVEANQSGQRKCFAFDKSMIECRTQEEVSEGTTRVLRTAHKMRIWILPIPCTIFVLPVAYGVCVFGKLRILLNRSTFRSLQHRLAVCRTVKRKNRMWSRVWCFSVQSASHTRLRNANFADTSVCHRRRNGKPTNRQNEPLHDHVLAP